MTSTEISVDMLDVDVSSSADWRENFATKKIYNPQSMKLSKIASLALVLVTAPVTALPNYSPVYQPHSITADAIPSIVKTSIGKPISRVDAIALCRKIMEDAEQRRRDVAICEAELYMSMNEEL
jgi:hypothetical protein